MLEVLIGCDGVNSVVTKWLGFKKPAFAGRSAIRGCKEFEEGHGLGNKFLQFFGKGVRFGFISCDDKTMYWFFTWNHSTQSKLLLRASFSIDLRMCPQFAKLHLLPSLTAKITFVFTK